MKNLLILSTSFLMVAGIVSITWAHGPNGGSGFSGHSHSKPSFSKPSFSRFGTGGRHGHSHFGSHSHSGQRHWGHSRATQQPRRLPRIDSGVILNNPGPLQNGAGLSPLEKAYSRGIGVSPLRKSLERKARPPVQHYSQPLRKSLERKARPPVQHYSQPPHLYHYNNSDAWFLYGNGDRLRQMGVIPPIPQASQELE